jgi:hypothetical protein
MYSLCCKLIIAALIIFGLDADVTRAVPVCRFAHFDKMLHQLI